MRIAGALLALLLASPAIAATETTMNPAAKRAPEPAVSMDVKDIDASDVLRLMQRQCGIRNLMIDPDVQGKATFYFREVPCRTAFDAVLDTFRLQAVVYSNSLAAVEKIH